MDDEKPKRDEEPAEIDMPAEISVDDVLYRVAYPAAGTALPWPAVAGTWAGFGMTPPTREEEAESYVDEALDNLESAIEELSDGPARQHLQAVLELLEEWSVMLK